MKKLLIHLIILGFVLSGCKKDKDDKPQNYIEYKGKVIELSSGTVQPFGEWGDGTNIDLTLFSTGISFTNNIIKGNGSIVYFEMYSSGIDVLTGGVYTFDPTASEAAGTFDLGLLAFDVDVENIKPGDYIPVTQGTITVALDGNEYEITVECVDSDNKEISLYYKGRLDIIPSPF